MRWTRKFSLAVALVAAAPAAFAESGEAAYKAAASGASKPLVTLSYGESPIQAADLRLPTGAGPYPVAVVIHGGCWLANVDDRSGLAAFADALSKRGLATWNIGYRRLGDTGGGWPGTFQDVASAVDQLPTVASKYNLDMKRIVFVGHSAGAYLALWAASRPKLPAPWSSTKVHPLSVVAIDGPSALAPFIGTDTKVCGKPVVASLMGGTPAEKPVEYGIASPAEHLPLGVHQLSVAVAFSGFVDRYVDAARKSGDKVDTLKLINASHFDIVTPGTVNGEAVADFIATKALAADGKNPSDQ